MRSPHLETRAINDQKPDTNHSRPTLLGSTNRNTTFDSLPIISPINCSRPNLFPTTVNVEEAYADVPKNAISY